MAAPIRRVEIGALDGMPLVASGDDLAELVCEALAAHAIDLAAGDIIVLAQKIVSKAEGRIVALADVTPSPRAIEIGVEAQKDPRLVELILSEATELLRVRPGVIIVRHRLGLVLANSGIDQSNVDHSSSELALLLPLDPDTSCAAIAARLETRTGAASAVLIVDSLGRAWRNGTIGTAIGVHGIPALRDLRGQPDLFGRPLQSSELGAADEIAAAASMIMGQGDECCPAVHIRGLVLSGPAGRAGDLVRPLALDLFR